MKIRITFDIGELTRKGIWMYYGGTSRENGDPLKPAPYHLVKEIIEATVDAQLDEYAYAAQKDEAYDGEIDTDGIDWR